MSERSAGWVPEEMPTPIGVASEKSVIEIENMQNYPPG